MLPEEALMSIKALQQTGLSVAQALPLAPAAERLYVRRPVTRAV